MTMTSAPHIMVHDYCGHPFTAEFSRQLCRNGWRVSHVFFAQDGGPKGRNALLSDDPEGLSFHALDISRTYSKTNFLKRRNGDIEYGEVVADFIKTEAPDIVLSGNIPTAPQAHLVGAKKAVEGRSTRTARRGCVHDEKCQVTYRSDAKIA